MSMYRLNPPDYDDDYEPYDDDYEDAYYEALEQQADDALAWSETMAEEQLGLTWKEWFDLEWEREI